MLNHLYNWLFRETVANQVKNLQLNKLNLIDLYTELDFDKLKKVQSVCKPFMVTGGYINNSPVWTLVFTLPSVYHYNHDILKKYILTNFTISHVDYFTLKLTIDDQTIIDDTTHPWKELWKGYIKTSNDNTIPYLTFPIQEINYQTIRFEVTFEKSVIEDPKDVNISFDICIFKNKDDQLNFFNAWIGRKYSYLVPKTQFKVKLDSSERSDWFLGKNQVYHEIIILCQKHLEEFPLETIKLIDHQDREHLLYLDNYDQDKDYYRVILTNNYVDGLSGLDWKSIEIVPKIGYREKIEQIILLCSGNIQCKNNKISY